VIEAAGQVVVTLNNNDKTKPKSYFKFEFTSLRHVVSTAENFAALFLSIPRYFGTSFKGRNLLQTFRGAGLTRTIYQIGKSLAEILVMAEEP
jgi:hypothetical protein